MYTRQSAKGSKTFRKERGKEPDSIMKPCFICRRNNVQTPAVMWQLLNSSNPGHCDIFRQKATQFEWRHTSSATKSAHYDKLGPQRYIEIYKITGGLGFGVWGQGQVKRSPNIEFMDSQRLRTLPPPPRMHSDLSDGEK
ncbi:hypothetical protein Q3G72_031153 [Acer saccharum]|nr:hypothetical protein Q3G72_031153 [Acer saccharum]